MPLTWMAIVGLALKVGIDVARYSGLRAERRAQEAAPPPAVQPPSPVNERTGGYLVCHWRVADPQAGKNPAHPGDRRPLVCSWTYREGPLLPVKWEVLQLIRQRPRTVIAERLPELVD